MGAEDQDITRTQGWSHKGEQFEPSAPSEQPAPELPPSGEISAPEDAAVAKLPETIGDYRILSKLGEGGMGVVYEAVQSNPRREVALKIVRGGRHSDPLHVRMFQREVDTLGRLRHPSIAAIYESGVTEDGQHFFAMELVRGQTLTAWLKERSEDPGATDEFHLRLELFRSICHAVAYAHQRGVIHRDIKPSNILVTERSVSSSGTTGSNGSLSSAGAPDVKVLDFGLARITEGDQPGATLLTEAGKVQGTLPYMSPEQVRGDTADIDLRTDVYSLGVVLYELLTGRLPYDLERVRLPEAARAICEDPPLPLTRTWTGRKKLDRDISTIVLKALEKEPDRRYQSVSGLGEDIERYLSDQPISARPPSALYQLRKLIDRHKLAFCAATAMMLLIVASSIGMTALYFKQQAAAREMDEAYRKLDEEKRLADEARQRAETERARADASRAEIERNTNDLLRIMPTLEQRLAAYEERERSLEQQIARDEVRINTLESERALRSLQAEGATATPVAETPPPAAGLEPPPAAPSRWGLFAMGGEDSTGLAELTESAEAAPTGSETTEMRLVVGRSLVGVGNYVDAESHLAQCYREFKEGPQKNEVRRLLVRVYNGLGNETRAHRLEDEIEKLER